MHRLLLHLPPVAIGGRKVEFEFARKHRLHHEDPTRVDLIFLPLSAVLSALIVLLALSWWIGHGDAAYVALFMATASFSTLVYEWTHYLTHSPYKPRSRYFRTIWKQHRWHHYKNEHYWFSFTMPWLDSWLGTGPDVQLVNASGTARHLDRTPEGESRLHTKKDGVEQNF